MKPSTKIALVAAGYLLALLLAFAMVGLHTALMRSPDSGMSAFSDVVLLVTSFCVFATLPTGLALVFLRSTPQFWNVLSVGSLAVSTTAIAAFVDYVAARGPSSSLLIRSWAAAAVLRILTTPFLAVGFFLAGILARDRGPQLALLLSGVVEALVFGAILIVWFVVIPR